MKSLTKLAWGVSMLLISTMVMAQGVYYSSSSDHSSEVATAAAKLAASIGGSATGFDAGENTDWTTALANAEVILLGQSSDVGDVSAGTVSAMEVWVSSGGQLHVLWSQENLDVFNTFLGSSLDQGGSKSTGSFIASKTSAAAGSSFDAAPQTLPSGSNHGWVEPASVPPSMAVMYEDGAGDAHVLIGNLGDGLLGYFSYDWCCGLSAGERDDWDAALLAGVQFQGLVTRETPTIPTMSTWGLLLLTGLALMLGAAYLRRRNYV